MNIADLLDYYARSLTKCGTKESYANQIRQRNVIDHINLC